MNLKDPKLTALQFNEHINNQNIKSLSNLMTEDHTFIDRKGEIDKGKESITKGWIDFFNQFPDYKNTFTRVESRGEYLVILIGYANWTGEGPPDHAIWTALIEDDLVAEWRIYEDTPANRKKFNIV
ncbi:MAG: nuclear transport factor 2 family protein [Candidatus Heimdallarchaeota archaeon]|nr:MAG: nuclear transport factor 2 family protein [Candidatus Heimdallarchaeota archaeon]